LREQPSKGKISKEDSDVLEAIDEWEITVQPHIEDPGVSTVSPDAYSLTQKIVTWCDAHSSIDAGIFWKVYRQITACRKPEPEGYIGSCKSPEIMRDTYRKAIDVCNRIFELIKSKKNAGTNSSGKARDTKQKKTRKKTPPQLLKETRERHAAQELTKNPNITAEKLGKKLECDKSTIVRLKAWQNRGILAYSPPPNGFKKQDDEGGTDTEAIGENESNNEIENL
jgi:hypothetical protein